MPSSRDKTKDKKAAQSTERLAGLGLTVAEIGCALGVCERTIHNWRKDPAVNAAYKKGRIEWKSQTVERLRSMVNDPRHKSHAAAVFFTLKTQFGWRETGGQQPFKSSRRTRDPHNGDPHSPRLISTGSIR